jgi:hypothetical protein
MNKDKNPFDEEGNIKPQYFNKWWDLIAGILIPFFGYMMFYIKPKDGVYCNICCAHLTGKDRQGAYCSHGGQPNSAADLNDNRGHQSTKMHQKAVKIMEEKRKNTAMEKEVEVLNSPTGRAFRRMNSPTFGPIPTSSASSSSSSSTASACTMSYSAGVLNACYNQLSAVAAAFLFQLVYWIIKYNVAFHLFQPLTGLLNHSGLTGTFRLLNHTSRYAFDCFVRILYVAVRWWMLLGLYGIGEYSIIMDESTTRGNISIILFYITFRKQSGRIVTQYLGMQVIGKMGGGADALIAALVTMLDECGLPPGKMRAFGSDGGGALSGTENGVWAKLQRDARFQHVMTIHCYAHQLALACKAVLKDGNTDPSIIKTEKLIEYASHYIKRSPKRTGKFKDYQVAAAPGEKPLAMLSSGLTRWLSRWRIFKRMFGTYGSAYLTMVECESLDTTKEKYLCKEVVYNMPKLEFMANAAILYVVHQMCAAVCEKMQTPNLNVVQCEAEVQKLIADLQTAADTDKPLDLLMDTMQTHSAQVPFETPVITPAQKDIIREV